MLHVYMLLYLYTCLCFHTCILVRLQLHMHIHLQLPHTFRHGHVYVDMHIYMSTVLYIVCFFLMHIVLIYISFHLLIASFQSDDRACNFFKGFQILFTYFIFSVYQSFVSQIFFMFLLLRSSITCSFLW